MSRGAALLLSLSLSGAVGVAGTALLARLLEGRVSRAALYWLWLPALLRLLLPFGLPGGMTHRVAGQLQSLSVQTPVWIDQAGGAPVINQDPALSEHAQNFEILPELPENSASEPGDLALCLWAAGAGAVLAARGVGYALARRRLMGEARPADGDALAVYSALTSESPRRPRLLISPAALSPMLLGLLRPVILLPRQDFSRSELEGVLAHELTHWRRRDLWVKWLAVWAAAVHWFNPAAWLLVRRLDRACELACDEAVIRRWDAPRRARYGGLILRLAVPSPDSGTLAAQFSQKDRLKERMTVIMDMRTHGKRAAALGGSACLLAALACAALGGVPLSALAAQPAAAPEEIITPAQTTPDSLSWPLETVPEVATPFGTRVHPLTGRTTTHSGIDLPLPSGTPVLAAGDGVVSQAGFDPQRGNYILLRHGGLTTQYHHLSHCQVQPGQSVSAGAPIASSGSTGMSTGPHLHFEVTLNGESVDPMDYLPET